MPKRNTKPKNTIVEKKLYTMTDFVNVLQAIRQQKMDQHVDPVSGVTKKEKVAELIYVINSIIKIQNSPNELQNEMTDNFSEYVLPLYLEKLIAGLKK